MEYQQEKSKIYRSYSVSSKEDLENISNGRCPEYALSWEAIDHQSHWEQNHDFLLGTNDYEKGDKNNIERKILKHKLENKPIPKIYCELENVLINFDDAIHKIFSEYPSRLNPQKMWSKLSKTPYFFENLEWSEEGHKLWYTLKQLDAIILTTISPYDTSKWSDNQKKDWCAKNLGENIQVITCEPNEKPLYCDEPNAILIDNNIITITRNNTAKSWSEAGGLYIHHQDANNTLKELLEQMIKIKS